MKRSKKILLWSSLLLGTVLALLASLASITPRVINREAVKNAIESTISRELGGTLTYERIDLAIFPRPGIILRKTVIAIPKTLSGTLNSLEISPSFLPLLINRFEIARVKLDHPDLVIELDSGGDDGEGEQKPFDQKAVQQTVGNILAVAASRMPNIAIIVQHGNLVAGSDGQLVYYFRDINSRISFQTDRLLPRGKESISPEHQRFRMIGKLPVRSKTRDCSRPVRLSIERFEALPKSPSPAHLPVPAACRSLFPEGSTDTLPRSEKAELALDGSLENRPSAGSEEKRSCRRN
jgi:hypothetical protein